MTQPVKNPLTDAGTLLEVIHSFIKITESAENEQDIYWAITKNFMHTLLIEDCVVYEAIPENQVIVQRAAVGIKNPESKTITNLLTLKYGEGIAGSVAISRATECIADVRKDKRYIQDLEPALSELCVPICCDGELYGIINSENSTLNFFNSYHVKAFELVADIAGGLIKRMRQKELLIGLKDEIEFLLEEKKNALNQAIETVSDQVSELKLQREKREMLLREVHHRVNNNLQILSSIVNLYLLESEEINDKTLVEIKQRIQILSSIHLILLKSVENNKHAIQDFLLDLIAAIRYMHSDNYLVIHSRTNLSVLGLNTLVAFGLLIYNVIDLLISCCLEKGQPIELNLTVTREPSGGFYLHIDSLQKLDLEQKDKVCVTRTLINALVEQLDGKIMKPDHNHGLWKILLYESE